MKKRTRIFINMSIITALALIFAIGCNKDTTIPDKTPVSLTDVEGNTYKTIKIGTQTWMAENLKTTKFTDNTAIPIVTGNSEWIGRTEPGCSWYANDTANKQLYGVIYNWYALKTGKLCPAGWHVPADSEYDTLEMYLGMPPAQIILWGGRGTDQGAKMKSATGWAMGENGTNTSGFTALPGGYRYAADGSYNSIGVLSYWWSFTEEDLNTAWYRRLDGNTTDIYRATTVKSAGKYVRCIMD